MTLWAITRHTRCKKIRPSGQTCNPEWDRLPTAQLKR